jgi:hypothetical protein
VLLLDLPDIGRTAARHAARDELRDRRYADAQPPLLVRVVGRLIREFLSLLDRAAGSVPGGRLGLLLLALVIAAFVAVVLVKLGPLGGRTRRDPLFTAGRALTADEHRAAAERAAAAGAWAAAVRERLRAVVRELEVRGVLDPRAGRTADEIAADAGAVVPGIAADLRRAATAFDEVWYGGRTADASTYALLVDVDRAVGAARLVVA